MNMFSFILKDFFEKESNILNITVNIIMLLKIYEFAPKDTEFVKIEIQNIIINL